jgi:membrane associated rhomboid family serine protease
MILAIYSLFSFNEKLKKISLYIELPFWILAWVAIIPLMIIDFFVELPIGNMAHLGGLLFGLAQGFYLVWKYPKKTEFLRRNYI